MFQDVVRFGKNHWQSMDDYLLEMYDTCEDELTRLGVRISKDIWEKLNA